MSSKKMKKYLLIYELEIEAKNIEKAEEIGDQEETKMIARLRRVEGKGEAWERLYDVDPSILRISSFKPKRK
jgi:hypothetical protein